jgi:hypothetical protein
MTDKKQALDNHLVISQTSTRRQLSYLRRLIQYDAAGSSTTHQLRLGGLLTKFFSSLSSRVARSSSTKQPPASHPLGEPARTHSI